MLKDRDNLSAAMKKNAKSRLSVARFEAILAAYGAKPERWPADERAAALDLAKTASGAKACLAEADRLDRALSALPSPEGADSAFLRRLATIPYTTARQGLPRPGPRWTGAFAAALGIRSLAPQGLAIAAAGIVGVWLGLSLSLPSGRTPVALDNSAYFAFNPGLDQDLAEAR